MRFDGFVRVLRSFLTHYELFSLPITPKHVNPLLTFKFGHFEGFYCFGILIFAIKLIEQDPISKNIAKIKKVAQ